MSEKTKGLAYPDGDITPYPVPQPCNPWRSTPLILPIFSYHIVPPLNEDAIDKNIEKRATSLLTPCTL